MALVGLLIVAWYVSTRGIFQGKASGDGFFGFMYLPSLVYFHTFDIGPNVPQWVPYLGHEKTGHVANACPVGPIVFWFPFYLIALGLEFIGRQLNVLLSHVSALHFLTSQLPPTKPAGLPGQTAFDFWMAGLGSLFAGLAGVGLLFKLLVRKVGLNAARAGVIGGVLATPIVFYFITQPLYQHATAFFCVTLFVERWDAYRTQEGGEITPKQFAILGALGGLAMDMRIQEAIFLVLPGMDAMQQVIAALRKKDFPAATRNLAGGLLLAIAALLAFSPQLGLWHWYFASFRTPQPAGHMRWGDPAIIATLFGTRAGIFPWMPIFYCVLPGLFLGRKPLGGLAGRLGLLFAVELWVNASAWDHWGSWAYGPRRFTDATVTFATGVAGLWWWAAQRGEKKASLLPARIVAALVGFFVGYNVLLAELVRQQKIKSSGAYAYAASDWIGFAKGPKWLAKVFDTVGYPFVQPAGWIYSLVYKVPVKTFEALVGTYLIDRDCRIHAVLHAHGFAFAEPGPYVPEGILGKADGAKMVPVAERVRVLAPMFAVEPLAMALSGDFGGHEAQVTAEWNGVPLTPKFGTKQVSFEVPESLVKSRSRTNEVVFHLPPNSKLLNFDVQSKSDWWR